MNANLTGEKSWKEIFQVHLWLSHLKHHVGTFCDILWYWWDVLTNQNTFISEFTHCNEFYSYLSTAHYSKLKEPVVI